MKISFLSPALRLEVSEVPMEDENPMRDLQATRFKGNEYERHIERRYHHPLPPLPSLYDEASRRSSLLSSMNVLPTADRYSDDKILSPNYYCQTRRGLEYLSASSSRRDSGVYSPSQSALEPAEIGRGRHRLRTMDNVDEEEMKQMIFRSRNKRETCV